MDTKETTLETAMDSEAVARSDQPRASNLFHAASGAVILGADWLLFSGNIATGGLATLPTMAIGFGLGTAGTALVQRFIVGDGLAKSLAKALVAGVLVGIPTPVAGTALGATILALSGLSSTSRKPGSGNS